MCMEWKRECTMEKEKMGKHDMHYGPNSSAYYRVQNLLQTMF